MAEHEPVKRVILAIRGIGRCEVRGTPSDLRKGLERLRDRGYVAAYLPGSSRR